jgi:hypothetical protein
MRTDLLPVPATSLTSAMQLSFTTSGREVQGALVPYFVGWRCAELTTSRLILKGSATSLLKLVKFLFICFLHDTTDDEYTKMCDGTTSLKPREKLGNLKSMNLPRNKFVIWKIKLARYLWTSGIQIQTPTLGTWRCVYKSKARKNVSCGLAQMKSRGQL